MARKPIRYPVDMPILYACYCPIHGDVLICPTCEGAKGGKKTAKIHAGKHKLWGKKGGRPRKQKNAK